MKIAVCGIGNELRGDDGIGPLVVKKLKELKQKNVLLLDCGSVPESFIGEIEKFKPDKIIIIDSVDLKEKFGAIKTVEIDKIKGMLISTHKLPISLFIEYIQKTLKAEIIFIGVQPKEIGFNKKMSRECSSAVNKVVERVLSL